MGRRCCWNGTRNHSSSGDYVFVNTGQENGFILYDGTAGVQVLYNGSVVQSWDSSGGTEITGGIGCYWSNYNRQSCSVR